MATMNEWTKKLGNQEYQIQTEPWFFDHSQVALGFKCVLACTKVSSDLTSNIQLELVWLVRHVRQWLRIVHHTRSLIFVRFVVLGVAPVPDPLALLQIHCIVSRGQCVESTSLGNWWLLLKD